MSYQLITQVWHLKLAPTQQLVLMAMADYANDDGGNCFPSQPRLAWKTGLSKSTIVRTIDILIAMRILLVVRPATNKAPARYQLCLDMGEMKAPYEDSRDSTVLPQDESRDSTVTPLDESRDSTVTPLDSLGWHSDTSGGSTVKSRGSTVLPDPIINLSYNQSDNGNDPFPEKATEESVPEQSADTAQIWALLRPELCYGRSFVEACLQGSELTATGTMLDGKPLYRLLAVKADNVTWLRQQVAGAISSHLRVILKKRISLEIIAELTPAAAP